MPSRKTSSFADLLRDWEALLAACDSSEALLEGLEPFRDSLSSALREAKELKGLQLDLAGTRRRTTHRLRETCDEGRDSARRLRSLVKTRLGVKLEQFGLSQPPARARKETVRKPGF